MIRDVPAKNSYVHLAILVVSLFLCPRVASAEVVRLLEATAMDWPEGRKSVAAELEAAGHEVVIVRTGAANPDALVSELTRASEGSVGVSATVIRVDRTGVAYVSFRNTNDVFRVTSDDPEPTRAAHFLSLRVADIVALQNLRFDPGPPDPKPSPAKPETPEAPRPKASRTQASENRWEIRASGGVMSTSGLNEPFPELRLGIARHWFTHYSTDLRGTISLVPGQLARPEGTVSVQTQSLALGAFLRFEDLLAAGPADGQLSVRLGIRAMLQCFEVSGTSPTEKSRGTGCTFSPGLSTNVAVSFTKHWSLWLGAEANVSTAPVRLLSGATSFASLGMPSLTLEGGLSWQF